MRIVKMECVGYGPMHSFSVEERNVSIMLLIIEGLTMCFLMLLVCVVGIANGPVGCLYFFEKEVQDRVVELGLTTEKKFSKKQRRRTSIR